MTLREDRTYKLPNGRQLGVKKFDERYILSNLNNEREDIHEYEVNTYGRLVSGGRLTAWSIDDLREVRQLYDLS